MQLQEVEQILTKHFSERVQGFEFVGSVLFAFENERDNDSHST